MSRAVRVGLVVLVAMALHAGSAAAQERVFVGDTADPGAAGIPCAEREGVRFCEGAIANRVLSFDNEQTGRVPLDVNVTLPAGGAGPWPLVIQLHGYGGRKTGLAASEEFAERGYAVLNYSARGFGNSCGSRESRAAAPSACARGWVKLADSRFEVRDSQFLAGLLADEGIADPQRVAPVGASYGGGQSLMLATLRDRVRLPDGSYAPWTSPDGRPMRIAAAAPVVPWSDLVYSLLPNGRTLDYAVTDENDDLEPLGVMKLSYVSGLFASGFQAGYYAPPGADPDADLTTWYARTAAGDPEDPSADAIARKIAFDHSAYYLRMDREPAPLLLSNGFTDDLFPVNEAIRYVNKAFSLHPGAEIAQVHYDFGHPRGGSGDADARFLTAKTLAFFDRHVKGDLNAPAPAGVEAHLQTCPRQGPSAPGFTAESWNAIHPGEVRYRESRPKTVSSISGDPRVGATFDPIVASARGDGACGSTSADDASGSATYRLPEVEEAYTLLGSPTVIADISAGSESTMLAARLFDVAPDGAQRLVARGLARPRAGGRQVFQLAPGAWRFEAGHVAKLELSGQDAPFGRPNNVPFALGLANVEIRLPVADRPDCRAVLSPEAPFLPAGAVLSPGVAPERARDCAGTAAAGEVRGRRSGSRCLPRSARVGSRGIGSLRLGQRRARAERRAGRPTRVRRGVLSWCVRGGGRVAAVLSAQGDIRLILTTAPGHRAAGGVRTGSSVRRARRAYRSSYSLRPGVLGTRRSSRVVLGTSRGRVHYLAVADRRLVKRPGLLRAYLRRGLR
ncbi:MAG TPA: CocE/NonD family hydrolase [Thermoleophilaceae bacterium]|nr:CocE/NonD family hydrolase [Thermoleophilaceae bacterium]